MREKPTKRKDVQLIKPSQLGSEGARRKMRTNHRHRGQSQMAQLGRLQESLLQEHKADSVPDVNGY